MVEKLGQPGVNPHAGRHAQSPGAAADAVACFGHEKYDCYRSSNSRGGMWQLNEQFCARCNDKRGCYLYVGTPKLPELVLGDRTRDIRGLDGRAAAPDSTGRNGGQSGSDPLGLHLRVGILGWHRRRHKQFARHQHDDHRNYEQEQDGTGLLSIRCSRGQHARSLSTTDVGPSLQPRCTRAVVDLGLRGGQGSVRLASRKARASS